MKKLLGIGIISVIVIVAAVWGWNRSTIVWAPPLFSPGQNINTSTNSGTGLDGTTFHLTSYNGTVLPQKYILSFKDSALKTRFCNAMDGIYVFDRINSLIQADLISTDMACSEPANIMEMEAMFGSILSSGALLSFGSNTITFSGSNPEKTTFVFEKI